MPAAPKYGERTEPTDDNLDRAELDLRRAQVESIEKSTEAQGTRQGLVVIVALVILTAAVPVEFFLWHLAFK